jgi:hypothetical protein
MRANSVVGYIQGYGIPQIRNWALSLNKHFTGRKIVIGCALSPETITWLESMQFEVYTHQPEPTAPVVTRFLYLWKMIEQGHFKPYEWITMSDVKDVVFQGDLNIWFDNCDSLFIGGDENVVYAEEPWGRENLITSYPYAYEKMHDKLIINAGTFSARVSVMGDICKLVYLMSINNKLGNPDQAALNVLLRSNGLLDTDRFEFLGVDSDYAIQIGTTFDPSKKLKQVIPLDDITFENGTVKIDSVPFIIVHQYDRNPTLKAQIDKLYT